MRERERETDRQNEREREGKPGLGERYNERKDRERLRAL